MQAFNHLLVQAQFLSESPNSFDGIFLGGLYDAGPHFIIGMCVMIKEILGAQDHEISDKRRLTNDVPKTCSEFGQNKNRLGRGIYPPNRFQRVHPSKNYPVSQIQGHLVSAFGSFTFVQSRAWCRGCCDFAFVAAQLTKIIELIRGGMVGEELVSILEDFSFVLVPSLFFARSWPWLWQWYRLFLFFILITRYERNGLGLGLRVHSHGEAFSSSSLASLDTSALGFFRFRLR